MSEKLPGVIWVNEDDSTQEYTTEKICDGDTPNVPRKELEEANKDLSAVTWSLEESNRHAENVEDENTALKAEEKKLREGFNEIIALREKRIRELGVEVERLKGRIRLLRNDPCDQNTP